MIVIEFFDIFYMIMLYYITYITYSYYRYMRNEEREVQRKEGAMRKPTETSSHPLPLACCFRWIKKHGENHLFYIKFVFTLAPNRITDGTSCRPLLCSLP